MLLQVCYYWQHQSSGLYQQPGRNSRWSLQGICGCCAWTGISTLQQYICQEPTQPREILEQHRLKSWHSGCPDCPPMTHFGDQTLMHKLQMCFSKTKAMKCYSNLLVAQVLSGVNSPSSENVVPNTSEHAHRSYPANLTKTGGTPSSPSASHMAHLWKSEPFSYNTQVMEGQN